MTSSRLPSPDSGAEAATTEKALRPCKHCAVGYHGCCEQPCACPQPEFHPQSELSHRAFMFAWHAQDDCPDVADEATAIGQALMAAIEGHYPLEIGNGCVACAGTDWPCRTLRVIRDSLAESDALTEADRG